MLPQPVVFGGVAPVSRSSPPPALGEDTIHRDASADTRRRKSHELAGEWRSASLEPIVSFALSHRQRIAAIATGSAGNLIEVV